MLPLRRTTRAALLGLALGDLIGLLRHSLDRNRRGDGSPSSAYADLALTLERFERLGGLDTVQDALSGWAHEQDGGGPDHSGAVRRAPLCRPQSPHPGQRSASARSGAGRSAGTPAGLTGP